MNEIPRGPSRMRELRSTAKKKVFGMIGELKFLVFVTLLVLDAARGELPNANDARTCMELCESREGVATFENGRCECIVPDDNARPKRDTDNLDLVASSPVLGTSDRSARCSPLGSRRRLASADADRVANYFMNGGPLTGSALLGKSNADCSPSSQDRLTGSTLSKSSIPVQPVAEPKVSSMVQASAPSDCANGDRYQPIVGTQWLPNYGMGPRMLGAHQPVQAAHYYPQDALGAVPHWAVLAIPNAHTSAAHIPAHHNPGLLGSPRHSQLLSSLASGTHGVLQRLDNMIAPYVAQSNHANIVSASHAVEPPCARSHQPSYQSSHVLGAPRLAATAPSTRLLQQVLAHQNTLLESLSGQLASYSPRVASPAMGYVPYVLGAAAPVGSGCYCPNGPTSPAVGAANPVLANPSKSTSDHVEAVKATNPTKSSGKDFDEDSIEDTNQSPKDKEKSDNEKTIVGLEEPAESNESIEEQIKESKRVSGSRSSTRTKRRGVK